MAFGMRNKPIFNAQSDQPQYEGQLQESHTFGASMVNQFTVSGSWYSALFSPANLAAATQLMPFRAGLTGNAFYSLGRDFNIWPQGRNVSQYGIIDDLSWQKGNHALKFGINYRRNDVTDYSPGIGTIGYSFGDSLQSFFNGNGDNYSQNFVVRPNPADRSVWSRLLCSGRLRDQAQLQANAVSARRSQLQPCLSDELLCAIR